jgi:hypothetical protein
MALYNTAACFIAIGSGQEAYYQVCSALTITKFLMDTTRLRLIYSDCGKIMMALGCYDDAILCYEKSSLIASRENNQTEFASGDKNLHAQITIIP